MSEMVDAVVRNLLYEKRRKEIEQLSDAEVLDLVVASSVNSEKVRLATLRDMLRSGWISEDRT